jgi:hypothetical protein
MAHQSRRGANASAQFHFYQHTQHTQKRPESSEDNGDIIDGEYKDKTPSDEKDRLR